MWEEAFGLVFGGEKVSIGVNRPELGGTVPNLYATSRMILRLFSSFQLEFTSDIQTFASSIRIVPLFFPAFSRFLRDAIPIFLFQTLTGMGQCWRIT